MDRLVEYMISNDGFGAIKWQLSQATNSGMSGSAQTHDGDAQNDNKAAAAADDNAQRQLGNSDGSVESNSHQDGGTAMPQSGQKQSAVVEQVKELISNEVIAALGEAQEEVREERGEAVNLNAIIGEFDGELTYKVLELEEGVPDNAIHVGGISSIVAGSNRQFTDDTLFASVHYDAKTLMNNANDDNSVDFSANYVEGTSMWHVIPTPTEGTGGPTIEEAAGDLIRETINNGHNIAVSLDGAEDLLRAE